MSKDTGSSDRNGSTPATTTKPRLRLDKDKVKVLEVRSQIQAGGSRGCWICTDTMI
jgi:hypothetical protein